MPFRLILTVCAAIFAAARAEAHAFKSGADQYAQFVEGAGVILGYPETLLPLIALGVLISLWQPEGMARAWPAFLVGQLLGIPLAALAGPWVIAATMALGLLTAALAALLPRHATPEVLGLALVTGALAIAASLEGHGLFELSVFIHLGILFAANLVTAAAAGLSRVALERVEALWMRVIWRVVASWLAAVLTLMLAFSAVQGAV